MKTNEEIVALAELVLAADSAEHELASKLEAKLDAELAGLESGTDHMLVSLAERLLAGRGFGIDTDNPNSLARIRSLATYLGATVSSDVECCGGRHTLILQPPPRN
jgi:hypothetical protein